MFSDCARVVGKWGTTLQKKLDEDKLRDKPWNTNLWACFDPFGLCLLTTFCPCITCGKTYHRLHNEGDMRDWEVVNVQCAAYGTGLCYTLGFVVNPCFLGWQTGRVRALGDIEGHCLTDCLKSGFCTCCSLIQNEKESKLLYKRRRVQGGDGVVDQQPTAGAGQEMVMPGPVEFGGVMQKEGTIGQLATVLETGAEESGIVRRDHAPSYLDGSVEEETTSGPKPEAGNPYATTTTDTSPNRPASSKRKPRTPLLLRCGLPAALTEPRSVARTHGSKTRFPDLRTVDSPLDETTTTLEYSVGGLPITEPRPPPQQTDGSAELATIPELRNQNQDAEEPSSLDHHANRAIAQPAHSESQYSQDQETVGTPSFSIGPIEPTIIHEPPTQDPDSRASTPSVQEPESHSEETVLPESVTRDDDFPQSTRTPQDAAQRAAVLESLVQEMVMLDQGSLDRLHLRSEWRWLRGAGGQAQGKVED